jgi:hypothetical protein
MTEKHFINFAEMLKRMKPTNPSVTPERHAMWCEFVLEIMDVFNSDNSRFNRERFQRACGYIE